MLGKKRKTGKQESSEYTETVEKVFERQRQESSRVTFERRVPSLVHMGCFAGLMILIGFYLYLPDSRVQTIRISGNVYLDDSYIVSVAGISQNDIYYLDLPVLISSRLKKDPMISSASVKWDDNGVILVSVKEKKPVAYRYDDEAVILLSDGSAVSMGSEYVDLISDIPYVTGFTEKDQTRLLCKALGKLDRSVISSIAEIHQYSLGYEDEAMKILMRTGGYYIGTYQNLDKLAYYREVYAAQPDHSYCITGFDSGNTAFSTVCPWNENKENVEYWTDESGNILKNSYGDSVVKHYYVDGNGNKATDASGNPIPIPIDSSNNEVIDSDFIAHYEAGYYATGVLVIP